MFYHASSVKGLKKLKPHISMHGESWVYFSDKKENVLVYLSNAVEKYIKAKYNRPLKEYVKWASYGFTSDGKIKIEEYYPNATEETFKGVKGYIYNVSKLTEHQAVKGIQNVYVTKEEVDVEDCEEIDDAYEVLLQAEKEGKIVIERYEAVTPNKKEWIIKTITKEFEETEKEDYKDFLLAKFDWLNDIKF